MLARVMDQHNREVMEMEDLLEQHLTEVHEDHQIKVRVATDGHTAGFSGALLTAT